jgi:RNA polymerase sigma-70 factor (ECF subfamily)
VAWRAAGIDKFERRASIKTWLFRILVNRAQTRSEREGRMVPFSAVGDAIAGDEPAVPADRFLGATDPHWAFHWAVPPKFWGGSPEEQLMTRETLGMIAQAISTLRPAQREVITLRDVEGWTSEEVCNVLGLTETNQRVLLHRARSRVRSTLERHLTRASDGIATGSELTCQELVELVTEYLEGSLLASERVRFESHVAACPFCTTYVDQMRSTIRALGRLPEETISPEALEQLRAHFRRWRWLR